MNPKFFSLPEEKQYAIVNAGFRVFSRNTYRKSPVSEIAGEAGISKALLFHYFRNKKELYLFLWDTCARITVEEMERCGAYEQTDLFDWMKTQEEEKEKKQQAAERQQKTEQLDRMMENIQARFGKKSLQKGITERGTE